MHYRADIDGLRAVAIGMVVAFHAAPGLVPSGYFGVDIFFVISGFLITGLLLRDVESGGISLSRFYISRVKRLFPAFLTVLAFCLCAGSVLLFAFEFAELKRHIISSLFFFQNYRLGLESGYFDRESLAKPLLHMWSLSIEEQFYLIWPAALILMSKLRGTASIWIISSGIMVSFGAALILPVSDAWKFYLAPTRFWELFVGVLLAYLMHHRIIASSPIMKRPGINEILAFLSLGLLSVIPLLPTDAFQHPGIGTLAPVSATVILIWAGQNSLVNRKLLSWPPLVLVGLISYPLYLWHWPLISFATIWNGGFPEQSVRFAIILLSILLAWLTYRYVERPFRFHMPTRKAFSTLILCSGTLVIVVALSSPLLDIVRAGKKDLSAEAVQAQLSGALWPYTENEICNESYPGGYRYFCMQNQRGSPDIMLVGNSYANHLYHGFAAHPMTRNMTILSYDSCEPSGLWPDQIGGCRQQDRVATRLPAPKYIIVSAIWPRFNKQGQFVPLDSEAKEDRFAALTVKDYRAALEERLRNLTRNGSKIAIFGPKAELGYEIIECFPRPLRPPRENCNISAEKAQQETLQTRNMLREIADTVPGVVFFDQQPLFCTAQICRYISPDGLPFLRDSGHYSEIGSLFVTNSFLQWVKREHPRWLN